MEKKVNRIFEYLEWRGDLDFDSSPFNEVDAAILCLLAYLDFTGLIPKDFSENSRTIKEVDTHYFGRNLPYDLRIIDLLHECAKTKRFCSVVPIGLVSELDDEEEKQFCAISFILPSKEKQVCIVFRGTDVTLIGWKEDFNMIFTFPAPFQEESVFYLERAVSNLKNYNFYVAGHSKGGNAAIYSTSLCSQKTFSKINKIYTFDSPGFDAGLADTTVFERPKEITSAFVPKDSVIGMLMDMPIPYSVVDSNVFGLVQHDVFSWEVHGTQFKKIEKLSNFSINVKKTMTKWLELLDLSQRRQVVNLLFGILEDCNIKEIKDFENISFSTVVTALKSFSDLDSTSKDCLSKALGLFFKAAINRNELDDFYY